MKGLYKLHSILLCVIAIYLLLSLFSGFKSKLEEAHSCSADYSSNKSEVKKFQVEITFIMRISFSSINDFFRVKIPNSGHIVVGSACKHVASCVPPHTVDII